MSDKHTVFGVPIEVVARLNHFNPRSKQDGAVLKKSSRKVECIGENRRNGEVFSLGQVFGDEKTSGIRDLYARSVQPMLSHAFDGYSICVLSAGATGAGKTFALDGDGSRSDGIIHLAVADLVNGLKEKATKREDGATATFTANVKYLEVFDEHITDLFDTDNSSVHIKENADVGVDFAGATVKPFTSGRDFINAYNVASQERLAIRRGGEEASRRAWSILVCDLGQEVQYPRQKQPQVLQSRAIFVDLPGDETLGEDPARLSKQYGPLANKSIFAFGHLVNGLAGSDDSLNHDMSVLTNVLHDAIGGNCVTLCIANITPTTATSSSRTLRLCRQIADIKNFPIPNDNQTQGLLRRYRMDRIRLQDTLALLRAGDGEGNADNDYTGHLMQMQGEILKLDQDKGKLRKNEDHLAELLQEMKAKYREAVEKKAELQSELIASEEDRLLVSKTLIDVQIENNELREENETGKFELVNKLLNAENDLLHLEVRLQEANKKNSELAEQIGSSDVSTKDLKQEFVALKANYVAAAKEHQLLLDKNEELQLEIVNLLNFKETVSGERDNLLRKQEGFETRVTKLQEQCRSMQKDRDIMQEELLKYRSENAQLREEASGARTAYETALMKDKGNVNERMMEISKEKDKEIFALKREIARLAQSAESAMESRARNESMAALSGEQNNRRITDLEQQIANSRHELSELRLENDSMKQKLSAMGHEFRDQLIAAMRRVESFSSGSAEVPVMLRQVQDDIVRAYSARDSALTDLLDSQRRQLTETMFQNKSLRTAYQELRFLIDEYRPTNRPLPNKIKETDDALAKMAPPDMNMAGESEISRLRSQLAGLDNRVLTLQDAEREVARLRATQAVAPSPAHPRSRPGTAHDTLVARNSELEKQVADLTMKLAAKPSGGAGGGGAAGKGNYKLKYTKELKEKLRFKSQAMELSEQNQLLTAELNKREEASQRTIMGLRDQLSRLSNGVLVDAPTALASPGDRQLSGRLTRSAGKANPMNLNPIESWGSPVRGGSRQSHGSSRSRPNSHYG